jgi:hypothetical protein
MIKLHSILQAKNSPILSQFMNKNFVTTMFMKIGSITILIKPNQNLNGLKLEKLLDHFLPNIMVLYLSIDTKKDIMKIYVDIFFL